MDLWLRSRLPALTTLTDAWDECRDGDRMGLVVVRGATGAGRTELLRRCYEHCAWGQQYWPKVLRVSPAALAQPLVPDPFRVPEGVSIPHLWVAVSARPGGFAVLDAATQLRDHVGAVRQAVLDSDTAAKRRLLAALDAALLVGSLVSLMPFATAVATEITLAGAGRSAPGVARDTWRAFRPHGSALQDALTVNAGRVVNPGQRDAARELANGEALSWARAAAIVPFVVAVDNAEHLDPASITFLSTLARHSGRGLMVLTVNTDREPADGPAGGNRVLADWLSEQARMGGVDVVGFDPAPDAELLELAADQLDGNPVQQSALASVIQASGGMPGRLMALLGDARVRRALTHEGAVMPTSLGGITRADTLRQRWAELPGPGRETLAKLALCGPSSPDGWRPTIVTAAQVEQASRLGWLRTGTLQFASRALWETALDQAAAELTDDQEDAVLSELSRRISQARGNGWAGLDPAVVEELLEAVIRGLGLDGQDDSMADLMRIRRVTGREAADTALLAAITRRITAGRPALALVTATGEALYDAGKDRQALDLLTQRLDDAIRAHGNGSPATIAPLSNVVAYWTALAQRRRGQTDGIHLYEQAISLCTQLLDLRTRHLPRTDRRIPDTRNNLADLHLGRNHPATAAQHLQFAVNEYRAILGPKHPQTLSARNNLAGACEEAGYLDRAITLFEQNLADREQVLGPNHSDTLASQNNLAYAYVSAGDLRHAKSLLRQNLSDTERVLGPDHPDTLRSVNNLAGAYLSAGDPDRAITLYRRSLIDTERILGPDDPRTFATRSNLAYAYEAAGYLDRAIPLQRQNLTDTERVLGPDHPHTLKFRGRLAGAYLSASDLHHAIPLLEQTLADTERVLRPDHPDTLNSRNNLALAYEDAGDRGRAIPLLEQNLSKAERTLGPDHPQTLTYRHNLAAAYEAARRPGPRAKRRTIRPSRRSGT